MEIYYRCFHFLSGFLAFLVVFPSLLFQEQGLETIYIPGQLSVSYKCGSRNWSLGKKMASIPNKIMNVSNTLCIYESLSKAQEWKKTIEIYNRIMECFGLEGTLKIIYQIPNPGQSTPSTSPGCSGPYPLLSIDIHIQDGDKTTVRPKKSRLEPSICHRISVSLQVSMSHLISLKISSPLNLGRPGRECSASCRTESSAFLCPICKPWTKIPLLSCSPMSRMFSEAGIFPTNLTQVQKTLSNYQP